VYVIVEVPEATPVTKPPLVIVATVVLDETHGFVVAAVPEPKRVTFEPTQIDVDPLMVGNGFTVTVTVCEQLLELVYVIVVVPTDNAVTNPVFETVATDVLDDIHGLEAEGLEEPVN
jgi:hypothetical protein